MGGFDAAWAVGREVGWNNMQTIWDDSLPDRESRNGGESEFPPITRLLVRAGNAGMTRNAGLIDWRRAWRVSLPDGVRPGMSGKLCNPGDAGGDMPR